MVGLNSEVVAYRPITSGWLRKIVGDVALDQHVHAPLRHGDFRRGPDFIEVFGFGSLVPDQSIVADDKTIGFTHADPMKVRVDDDIPFDEKVPEKQLVTGFPEIDPVISKEDRLRPVPVPRVEDVVADRDALRRRGGACRPELDHVRMIARCERAPEAVERVTFDQHVPDLGKVDAVLANAVEVAAHDTDIVGFLDRKSDEEPADFAALDGQALHAIGDQRLATRKARIRRTPPPDDVTVKDDTLEGDIAAVVDPEGRCPDFVLPPSKR